MSEDYRQGFKDGFAAGLEEGKKQQKIEKSIQDYLQKPFDFPPYVPSVYGQNESCPKCGMRISGVMGYVCNSPNCPTFMQVTCDTAKPMSGGLDSGLGKAIFK